jgi:hypothetical protein
VRRASPFLLPPTGLSIGWSVRQHRTCKKSSAGGYIRCSGSSACAVLCSVRPFSISHASNSHSVRNLSLLSLPRDNGCATRRDGRCVRRWSARYTSIHVFFLTFVTATPRLHHDLESERSSLLLGASTHTTRRHNTLVQDNDSRPLYQIWLGRLFGQTSSQGSYAAVPADSS